MICERTSTLGLSHTHEEVERWREISRLLSMLANLGVVTRDDVFLCSGLGPVINKSSGSPPMELLVSHSYCTGSIGDSSRKCMVKGRRAGPLLLLGSRSLPRCETEPKFFAM